MYTVRRVTIFIYYDTIYTNVSLLGISTSELKKLTKQSFMEKVVKNLRNSSEKRKTSDDQLQHSIN